PPSSWRWFIWFWIFCMPGSIRGFGTDHGAERTQGGRRKSVFGISVCVTAHHAWTDDRWIFGPPGIAWAGRVALLTSAAPPGEHSATAERAISARDRRRWLRHPEQDSLGAPRRSRSCVGVDRARDGHRGEHWRIRWVFRRQARRVRRVRWFADEDRRCL